jgi:hypothetical protein
VIKNAAPGRYEISVKLFSSLSKFTGIGSLIHLMANSEGTTTLVKIWTHYANPSKEKEYTYTVRFFKDREVHQVASVVVS